MQSTIVCNDLGPIHARSGCLRVDGIRAVVAREGTAVQGLRSGGAGLGPNVRRARSRTAAREGGRGGARDGIQISALQFRPMLHRAARPYAVHGGP